MAPIPPKITNPDPGILQLAKSALGDGVAPVDEISCQTLFSKSKIHKSFKLHIFYYPFNPSPPNSKICVLIKYIPWFSLASGLTQFLLNISATIGISEKFKWIIVL